jgi:YD repeat-containing protein
MSKFDLDSRQHRRLRCKSGPFQQFICAVLIGLLAPASNSYGCKLKVEDDIVMLEPFNVTDSCDAMCRGERMDMDMVLDKMTFDNDPWLSDNDDSGGGTEGTPEPTCTGVDCNKCPNHFTVQDGNAHRDIKDLAYFGGDLGFTWKRFHNTRRVDGQKPFGVGGEWRHNWQHELIKVTGPDGVIRYHLVTADGQLAIFSPSASGGWISSEGASHELKQTAGGFEVAFKDKETVFAFERSVPISPTKEVFLLVSVTNERSQKYMLTYDEAGCLTRVAHPLGRQFNIHYKTLSYNKSQRYHLGYVAGAGTYTLAMPTASQAIPVRTLFARLSQDSQARLSEIRFFAPGSATPLAGRLVAVSVGRSSLTEI